MTDSELRERSLFATIDDPIAQQEEHTEDDEMIVNLMNKCDRLQTTIDELKETNMMQMLILLAVTTIYTCILVAVLDVKNNPEL